MDLYTLNIAHFIVYFMIAGFMLVLYLLNRSTAGPFWWMVSALMTFFGFLAQTFVQGNTGIFLNNCGTLLGILALTEGVLRFKQLGNPYRRVPILFVATIFMVMISYTNQGNPTMRYLMHDAIVVVLSVTILVALLHKVSRRSMPVYIFAALPFGLLAVLFAYRWTLALIGEFETSMVGSIQHPFQPLLFLLVIPYNIGWGFGFGVLILHNSSEQLRKISLQDDLTHLANRRGLEEWFTSEFHPRLLPTKKKLTVGLFDLNSFKLINDTFGHGMGDQVIRHIGDVLKLWEDKTLLAVRLGGDEFVLVLTGESYEENRRKLQIVIEAIEEPFQLGEFEVIVRVSLGLADYPANGCTIGELLHSADMEMYREKDKANKSTVVESVYSYTKF